jgi:hypothetical protein
MRAYYTDITGIRFIHDTLPIHPRRFQEGRLPDIKWGDPTRTDDVTHTKGNPHVLVPDLDHNRWRRPLRDRVCRQSQTSLEIVNRKFLIFHQKSKKERERGKSIYVFDVINLCEISRSVEKMT